MKSATEILNRTLTLSDQDRDFIQKKIDEVELATGMPIENKSFNDMMFGLFTWSSTAQGHKYWSNVVKKEDNMVSNLENYSNE